MKTTKQQMPRLMPVMTRMLTWLKLPQSMPVVPNPRQMNTMLYVTSPHIAKVKTESTADTTWACLVQTAPVSPPATPTRQTMMQKMETTSAMILQRTLSGAIWQMVAKRTQKQMEGVRQLVQKESRASTMDMLSLTYLSMKLWRDSMALKQQLRKTQRKAKRLLLIQRRRCFIRFQWSFIGSVLAIASGTQRRQYCSLVWQQMPRERMRSSARYILASRQSFSSNSGFRIILKQLCSSRLGSYSQDLIRALQRQADQAPGSTWRNPKAPSAFLSRKWAMMYSYSCAFSMEKKDSLIHLQQQFSSSSSSSSPPSREGNYESTLISPVHPPTSLSMNPLIRFTTPVSSGFVPTSSSTMYSGSRQRQKPSKNHRWEESLVPLRCLKQLKILRYLPSKFYPARVGSVMPGCHRFWQRREMFFSMEGGKSRLLPTQLAMPLRLQLSISSRMVLMRSSRSHLGLPSNSSSLRQNSTIEFFLLTQVRLARSATSLRMPSCMSTTATSSQLMPSASRFLRLSQMPERVSWMAFLFSLYMHTQARTLIFRGVRDFSQFSSRRFICFSWQISPSFIVSSRRSPLSGHCWSKILEMLVASTGRVQAHMGMLLWSIFCWYTRGEKKTLSAGYVSRFGSSWKKDCSSAPSI